MNIKEKALEIFESLKEKYIHLRFKNRMAKDKLLLRYIIKELSMYFLLMFLFYFLIFFVNQILVMMLKLLGKNLPLGDVILLMFYSIPSIISQTAPFAVLTGFLMCLGRMNSDNEILIFRASGQNPRLVILVPVLALGFLISLFSFFVNDYLLPSGLIKYREQYLVSISRNPFIEIESNSVKRFNENTIITGEVKNSEISDIVFIDRDENHNTRIISGKKSHADTSSEDGVTMQLTMENADVFVLDSKDKNDFSLIRSAVMKLNIFESAFIQNQTGVQPNEMTSYDIYKEIKKIKKNKNHSKEELNQFVIEFNKKYALSFGALFFAFLALPLALIFGKQNGTFAGLIIGILISAAYWALIWIFMLAGYRNGLNGFIAMWMPNILVGLAGFGFYSVMMRQ
ncbi:MAG: LptF/LptG family permease [Treponema sp.]|uniref:LptF/LptG family permease n=1 Tax=Treponema sp. TaxID=166 RepID=UPI00298E45F0|nr:LptF/LptG family permease [Treponema sp.]MBR0155774.1 LptF/LptG family permease [Treponema sp.]MCR5387065.1 LptF/LptG family permease [Treponema sp.]